MPEITKINPKSYESAQTRPLAFLAEPNEVVPARTIPCEHTHNLMEVAMIVRNRKGKRKHRK